MGFYDRSKKTDYLRWGEKVNPERQGDLDEPAHDIGETVLGTPRNIRYHDSRFEDSPSIPWDSPQSIDGETMDGINVREVYRGVGEKDVLGVQIEGAVEGRL